MELQHKLEWEKEEKRKTDQVLKGILSLVKKIFYEGDSKEAYIDEVEDDLGVLGNELGGSEKSHYTIDDAGLTISLNYSRNKDENSYSKCFGDYVNWDYLRQSLLEYGIEINREIYDRNPNRDQRYHHFDIITIKVNRLVKSAGMGYRY